MSEFKINLLKNGKLILVEAENYKSEIFRPCIIDDEIQMIRINYVQNDQYEKIKNQISKDLYNDSNKKSFCPSVQIEKLSALPSKQLFLYTTGTDNNSSSQNILHQIENWENKKISHCSTPIKQQSSSASLPLSYENQPIEPVRLENQKPSSVIAGMPETPLKDETHINIPRNESKSKSNKIIMLDSVTFFDENVKNLFHIEKNHENIEEYQSIVEPNFSDLRESGDGDMLNKSVEKNKKELNLCISTPIGKKTSAIVENNNTDNMFLTPKHSNYHNQRCNLEITPDFLRTGIQNSKPENLWRKCITPIKTYSRQLKHNNIKTSNITTTTTTNPTTNITKLCINSKRSPFCELYGLTTKGFDGYTKIIPPKLKKQNLVVDNKTRLTLNEFKNQMAKENIDSNLGIKKMIFRKDNYNQNKRKLHDVGNLFNNNCLLRKTCVVNKLKIQPKQGKNDNDNESSERIFKYIVEAPIVEK